MNTLLSILEDGAGGSPSSIRVVMLIVVLGTILPWAYVSIAQKQLQPFPDSVVTLYGLTIAGKVAQRPMEKSNETKT